MLGRRRGCRTPPAGRGEDLATSSGCRLPGVLPPPHPGPQPEGHWKCATFTPRPWHTRCKTGSWAPVLGGQAGQGAGLEGFQSQSHASQPLPLSPHRPWPSTGPPLAVGACEGGVTPESSPYLPSFSFGCL